MIAIIDYGMGNLRSVQKAFEYLGFEAVVTDDISVMEQADKLVLPGVGAFADAIATIREKGFDKVIYSAVKAVDEDIEVGISPQGNIENNYQYLYADVERWLTEDGYCDCMIPQIYYGYDNTVKPYLETLNTWRAIDKDKKLVIGLAVYKIGSEDEFTDNAGIICRQAEDALTADCQGYALYNYISLFEDSDRMSEERSCILSDSVV